MDLQFYPTPEALAEKAWNKFNNKSVARLLEPSAGEGHLIKRFFKEDRWHQTTPIDVVEIDISKHPMLKSKGFNVVGIDFLEFNGASLYSHIIMNPVFNNGVKHVLKAWEILFDGELVAILNAESIKNAFSGERKMLLDLIELHGSVEFLQEEFLSDDADRKTSVEIALIHLTKSSNFEINFLAGLKADSMTAAGLASGFKEFNDVAIHQGFIDNLVVSFNAAVKAAKEEIFAAARSRYYANMIGDTMELLQSKDSNVSKSEVKANLDTVRFELQERYENLKNRAWTQLLRSSNITSRLSSAAQKRLESEFENIKQLEFTVANIYGFILGIIDKKAEINKEMVLDIFDTISKYHSENRVYYKGWKSNSKHRTAAFKVKATRFVLPRPGYDFGGSVSWDTIRFLADFDKVFSMLDGKTEPECSLAYIFDQHFKELRHGARVSSSYFDIRYYPGAGTLHFFPTNKKLIDRFNRLVGTYRQWLPQENEATDAYWGHYENAEKFSADIQTEIKQRNKTNGSWNSIERDLTSNDEQYRNSAIESLDEAIDAALCANGIDPLALIESNQQQSQTQLPLLAA
jgi:hypothetical protein